METPGLESPKIGNLRPLKGGIREEVPEGACQGHLQVREQQEPALN